MPTLTAAMFPLLFLAPPADPWLGIYFDMESDAAVVGERIPGSPAEKAGIEPGDVLLAVGDRLTPTRDECIAAIRGHKAGDEVAIRLRRDGKERTIKVVLGQRPATAAPSGESAPGAVRPGAPSAPMVEARPAAPKHVGRGYLGLRVHAADGGVVVDESLDDSPAQRAGIHGGEVLAEVGGQSVRSLDDLDRLLGATHPGQVIHVTLRGHDGTRSLAVRLGTSGEALGDEVSAVPAVPAPIGHGAAPNGSAAGVPGAPAMSDLAEQVRALRAELADLRRQLEQLRQRARE